jgi:hypothetical protein
LAEAGIFLNILMLGRLGPRIKRPISKRRHRLPKADLQSRDRDCLRAGQL